MGVALQIFGFLLILIALILGIGAIINKTSATPTVVFLLLGGTLIRIGRKMH